MMKLNPSLVLLVALVIGAGAFTWRALWREDASAVREPELRWLQREFALNDDVLLHIADLHRRYIAECEPTCKALRASDAEATRVLSAYKRVTPEVTAALERSNKILVECQYRMLEHFYAVADAMPPAARERYLVLMTPVALHPERGWMQMTPVRRHDQ